MMSATWAKPSVRSRCCAAVRGEAGERVLALDAVRRAAGASPARPEHDRAVARAERTSSQPMCGCSRSAGMRRGWRSLDLLQREPARLAPSGRRARGCPSRARRRRGRRRRSCPGACACCRPWPRRRRGRPSPAARRRRRYAVTSPPASERSTSVVEAVAVALLERGALGLAVVGEDDDLVGPRRVAAGALDAPELLVELAQRLERVGALEARVVRDLVVARERRVDRGAPAHHVGQHAEDDEVADEHAHRRAQERVDAAAVAARAARRGGAAAPRRPARARPPSRRAPASA